MSDLNPTPVIAIDGHAGAGKSTVADLVAQKLGFWHVNTGLYYRAVTWLALQQGLGLDQAEAIAELAAASQLDLRQKAGRQEIYVGGEAVTDQVRSPEINRSISRVSAYAGVREVITSRLQALTHPHGIIMDGRDIGTVVYPQAVLKIFLTASVEERARRQHEEALSKGQNLSLEEFQEMVATRDQQDSQREVAPLRQAEDAVCLDSTGCSPEAVAAEILALWQQRQAP